MRNTLMRQYLTYLRVEKGLRPLTCQAYERDLSLYTEYLEAAHALPVTAGQQQVAGFLEHLQKHGVQSRSVARKGVTIVPLDIHFNEQGRAKVLLGVGEGRNKADKRHAIADRDWKRDKDRLLRARG